MAILVSGGAGYIGSHTCIELLNAGFDIVVADNYYNASPVVLDRVKQITGKDFRFYQADMTKHEDVEKIFTECPDIDAVIHINNNGPDLINSAGILAIHFMMGLCSQV